MANYQWVTAYMHTHPRPGISVERQNGLFPGQIVVS
jgi:hypothetical protein